MKHTTLYSIVLLAVVDVLSSNVEANNVLFKGKLHAALGSATVTAFGDDSLVVSNIGPSGNDGVAIALSGTMVNNQEFDVESPSLSTDVPIGSFIDVKSRGVVDGVPNVLVFSQRMTRDSMTTLHADFDASPLNPSTVLARGYVDGVLDSAVAFSSATFSAALRLATNLTWNVSLGIPCCPDISLDGSFGAGSATDGFSTLRLSGPGHFLFAFLPQTSHLVSDFSEMEIRGGGGLTRIVITNEEHFPSPAERVPILSSWGMIVLLVLLVASGGVVVYLGRRKTSTANQPG